MKRTKKILAALSLVSTFILSNSAVFADETSKTYDFSYVNENITYDCILKDDCIDYVLTEHCNGIVFKTEEDIDVNSMDLKYDFIESNQPTWGTAGINNIVLGHNSGDSENVYSCHVDGDVLELTEYANELSEKDGIIYAEVFTIDVRSKGEVLYAGKDDCRILIKASDEPDKYLEKLSSNSELKKYLSDVGLNPEIKMLEKESDDDDQFLYISGINDRTDYFEICDSLRNFKDIGNNLVTICEVLVSPTSTVDFINRDYTGDANADKYIDVRDCAEISSMLALRKGDTLPETADYNKDGNKDVRDAAFMARDLATGNI